jgi:hypothetical protein
VNPNTPQKDKNILVWIKIDWFYFFILFTHASEHEYDIKVLQSITSINDSSILS